MATKTIRIKSTVKPSSNRSVRVTTSVSNGNTTRTTTKTVRVR